MQCAGHADKQRLLTVHCLCGQRQQGQGVGNRGQRHAMANLTSAALGAIAVGKRSTGIYWGSGGVVRQVIHDRACIVAGQR